MKVWKIFKILILTWVAIVVSTIAMVLGISVWQSTYYGAGLFPAVVRTTCDASKWVGNPSRMMQDARARRSAKFIRTDGRYELDLTGLSGDWELACLSNYGRHGWQFGPNQLPDVSYFSNLPGPDQLCWKLSSGGLSVILFSEDGRTNIFRMLPPPMADGTEVQYHYDENSPLMSEIQQCANTESARAGCVRLSSYLEDQCIFTFTLPGK